jgi:hypothetical protein
MTRRAQRPKGGTPNPGTARIYEWVGDGWYPHLSDDGTLVAFGNTDLKVVDMRSGATWPIGEGRSLRFIGPSRVTWLRYLDDDNALRYEADLTAFDGGYPTDDPTGVVASNEFDADEGGHWGAYHAGQRRLVYDGAVLIEPGARGVSVAGELALTVLNDATFDVYTGGQLSNRLPLPANANAWRISRHGWISYGYWGRTYAYDPAGVARDLTATPWAAEGVAAIYTLPSGEAWAFTSTERPDGRVSVIGRPVGDHRVVECVGFAAINLSVGFRSDLDAFVVAGESDRGALQVWTVDRTAPRAELAADPTPEPPKPEPPPARPDVSMTYTPTAGSAPLTVTSTAVVSSSSGPVDTYAWRMRRLGSATWERMQRGPAPTWIHEFVEPGQFELGLDSYGPGGSDSTGQQRLVTVEGTAPQPEPPQPEPPPGNRIFCMPTGPVYFLSDSGRHWLRVDHTKAGELRADCDATAYPPADDAWERLTVEDLGSGKVALKAVASGQYPASYLHATDGGTFDWANVHADRDVAGAHEEWIIGDNADGRVTIRTAAGWYLSADQGGGGLAGASRLLDPPPTYGWELFTPSVALFVTAGSGGIAPAPIINGRIRIDHRMMVNDAGLFRPVFASALSALAPGKDALTFLDWVVSAGFNGVRTFAGALTWANQTADSARAALPGYLEACRQRGLYVEIVCLTDTGEDPFDKDAHLAAIRDLCLPLDHVTIELANEFYHETQDDQVHDSDWLRSKVPMFRDAGLAVAIGAPPEDEPNPDGYWDGVGGSYGCAHLDRGRDKWNQVRRVREIENCSDVGDFPVWNGEPIGAAEPGASGQRIWDPEFFFCMGALNRVFEVGGVFHFQDGLDTRTPVGTRQQECAAAFQRGFHALDGIAERLTFKNTSWSDSPCADANFSDRPGGTVVRVYNGVSGNRGYTVTVGETGDPGIVWQHGWHPVRVVDEMGSHDPAIGKCVVMEIQQG